MRTLVIGLVGAAGILVSLATGSLAQEAMPSAAAPPASPIVWRLKNPFRYFKKPEHTALHLEALRTLAPDAASRPVLATERSLAEKTGGHGWAAGVFEHVADEACWYKPAASPDQPQKKPPVAEPCGQYVNPKAHAVLLQAPSLAGPCTWTIGALAIDRTDCRQPAEAAIPYPEGAEVVLSSAGAPVASETIRVEDLLVIGLGDSFGAGDGNPDRPVSFRVNRPMSYDAERDGYPQRAGLDSNVRYTDPRFRNKGAGWVHHSCHRSLYSHQLRTALQLALDDPAQHRSVTYLGFACTGSTMLTMFGTYNGLDEQLSDADPVHSRRKMELSQLDILAHVLCAPGEARLDAGTNYNADEALEIGGRAINIHTCDDAKKLRKPDLILLSVGGNDVGFSGLVSNAALLNRYLGYVKLFDDDPRVTPQTAHVFMGRIPGRYAALAKALKTVTGISDPSRILLTAYPHMHENQDGKLCGSGTRGFDVSVAWSLQSKAVAATQTFMEDVFTPATVKAAAAAGWTFVSAHRSGDPFKRHGICAVTPEEESDPSLSNVRFPRFRESGSEPGWAPYKPDDYLPYASRQRWFLTPNDAFLATHYHTTHMPILDGGPEVQLALWSAYSGAFHPTAEGQAAIADAVLAEARKLLAPRAHNVGSAR